jgi:tetratricopeptide (TPR) repeat protein
MKLVKGRTLQSVLNAVREGEDAAVAEFTRAKLLTIFRKVCDAMAFAHSKGVLHRDLKPENVMVGEYGEVLVMDWGLAKVIGVEEEVQVGVTTRTVSGGLSGDFGVTMEGEVMGTPQYMSPEQAEGVVAGLDERSDVYALGAILYAVVTYKPPVDGKTLDEVLGNVRRGILSSMATAKRMTKGIGGRPEPMPVEVPEALRAVVLKAMAREKEKRYGSVGELAADVDAFLGGFATRAEGAGMIRRVRLWVGRNRVLSSAAAVLVVFGAKVVVDGQTANRAMRELKESAPVFAERAEALLRDGEFEEAERSAKSALRLNDLRSDGYVTLGKVYQVRERWEDAVAAFEKARSLGADTREFLRVTQGLVAKRNARREDEARGDLFEALRDGGRQMESVGYAKALGDEFWRKHGERLSEKAKKQGADMARADQAKRRDPSVIGDLIARLEAKLLPVPGTGILLSKTEFTVGEWKLYLRAEGLPEWHQPDPSMFTQTDEHPVVKISWNDATKFCRWLSQVSGKRWRLPKNEEWEAAVGKTTYPWGEYYPPKKEDGNFAILSDGKDDPAEVGLDGFKGTAPVASFRANPLGFFDLGGNAFEMTGTLKAGAKSNVQMAMIRGGSWSRIASYAQPQLRGSHTTSIDGVHPSYGFRVCCEMR